jgi:3-oxoacyl-[acyl-carrier protein] reductase
MDLGIDSRAALVMGSTSGLGLAVAKSLVAEGARVMVAGRDEDTSRKRAAEIGAVGAVAADLTGRDSAARVVDEATRTVGEVDILVMNCGGPPPGAAKDIESGQLRDSLEVLLVRQIELVERVLPGMITRGWGRLVAIGSSGVQQPIRNLALSNIGRVGLAGYLKTLAAEVAGRGVTVNMVLPGRIATDRIAALDASTAERENVTAAEIAERSRANIPMGRYGDADEFAAMVTFLCSDLASYVTGEQIRCDGGLVGSF